MMDVFYPPHGAKCVIKINISHCTQSDKNIIHGRNNRVSLQIFYVMDGGKLMYFKNILRYSNLKMVERYFAKSHPTISFNF